MSSHSKTPPRSGGQRGSKGADVSARQRELYALPLEGFTRARDALAKELAAKGRAKDAQATRKLKRPVVAAWVVNQLAHQHPEHLEELLSSTRTLEKAYRRAGSGLAPEALKEANRAFQRALDALMNDVTASLASTGRPATGDLIRQVDETLRAASLGSEEERSALSRGMLTRPLHSSGFGPFSPLQLVGPSVERTQRAATKQPPSLRTAKPLERAAPPPPRTNGKVLRGPWAPRPPRPSQRRARAEAAAEARLQRDAELRQLRREAKQQVEEAERAERNVRHEVTRSEAALKTAEARTLRARDMLDAAEAQALRAREALEAAEEKAQQAREALERSEDEAQAQSEAVSQANARAQAAQQATAQARRHLQQAESHLHR